jgi:hypothetical protein
MCLQAENKLIETEDIKITVWDISRGLTVTTAILHFKGTHCHHCHSAFQGDSLSPLPFCIRLIPLTEQLNRLNTGYEEHTTKTKISHLLYMDNLKLIAEPEEELQKRIQTVKIFSDDIHKEFGLEKCAKITFKRG